MSGFVSVSRSTKKRRAARVCPIDFVLIEEPRRDQTYCSSHCRARAWRRRQRGNA